MIAGMPAEAVSPIRASRKASGGSAGAMLRPPQLNDSPYLPTMTEENVAGSM